MTKKKPILTVGMAQYEDFDGCWSTIQSLRANNKELFDNHDIELVVVDNSPHSPDRNALETLVTDRVVQGGHLATYFPMDSPAGTSPARDKIFEIATGDFVLVCDCHVQFMSGAITRLVQFYRDNPDTRDIYSGPVVYDTLDSMPTHFDDVWRSEMWGIWGQAWQCKCGEKGGLFSMGQENDKTKAIKLEMGFKTFVECPNCKARVKKVDYAGHETKLEALGYKRLGRNPDDKPFEIPGQGLGCFSTHRESWLGFNPHARGFGGEELYIHQKYRDNGRKAMCLPFLQWIHRFYRSGGAKYSLTRWGKIRNYVLEFQEMGWDLEPIKKHFVDANLLQKSKWDKLISDPEFYVLESDCKTCGGQDPKTNYPAIGSVDDAFNMLVEVPRDLDEHMERIKFFAANCDHITEVSDRRESTIALLAGKPKQLISHNTEFDNLCLKVHDLLVESKDTIYMHDKLTAKDIKVMQKTDMLFLDSSHTYDGLLQELKQLSTNVSRYIIIHDTQLFANKGQDGGMGMLTAIREFMQDDLNWQIIEHHNHQHGLTVLSRDKRDKPKLPSKIKMASNFVGHLIDHTKDGLRKVPKEIWEDRMKVCTMCPQRVEDRCGQCGCPLKEKGEWASSECPLGYWGTFEKGESDDTKK